MKIKTKETWQGMRQLIVEIDGQEYIIATLTWGKETTDSFGNKKWEGDVIIAPCPLPVDQCGEEG